MWCSQRPLRQSQRLGRTPWVNPIHWWQKPSPTMKLWRQKRLECKEFTKKILVGGAITVLNNMKVSGKDYPIYYGKWKMFETTSQSTLNDSIVDDSRLCNLFGGVRDSFLVQPLWFSTNHGSTHLLHQRPTHDTNECDKIEYIPPKIIKNYLANLKDTLHRAQFSAIWYISYISIYFFRWRKDHQTQSNSPTQGLVSKFISIHINLWLHQGPSSSVLQVPLYYVSLVNWILGHGLAKGL